MTWATLLDGYNGLAVVYEGHPNLVYESIDSGRPFLFFGAFLSRTWVLFDFLFPYVVIGLCYILLAFGFWLLILKPIFRKLGQW